MEEEPGQSPPISPPPVRKSRKSGLAAARRLSRASTAAGVPFEDLLATLPSPQEADTKKRLEKLLGLVVSSSTRELAETFRDHEDEALEEASRSLRTKLRADQISASALEEAVKALEEGGRDEKENEVVGGELKKMRDYTKQLQTEGELWKRFMSERKEMMRNAKKNAELVKTGEISVEEDVKWTLSGEERRKLDRRTEKISEAYRQVQSANTDPSLEVVLRDISTSCVRAEAEQDKVSERLKEAVRRLGGRADSLAEK